jgi:hypothetical protein
MPAVKGSVRKPARRPAKKPVKSSAARDNAASPVMTTRKRTPVKPRKMKKPAYKHFRLQKRISIKQKDLPPAYVLLWRAMLNLGRHWKLFGGVLLIYGILNAIFVNGVGGNAELAGLKDSLQAGFSGNFADLTIGLGLYGLLLGSAGNNTGELAQAYQSVLVIIGSLALIWALRNSSADTKVRIRDAYYKGCAQIIPFLLVLCVIGLQLVPAFVVGGIYYVVSINGLAALAIEKGLWMVLTGLFILLSLYMVSSSLLAMYIVTLPGFEPMQSLRAARKLVRFRRWEALRKVVVLPITIIIATGLFMIPIILYATGIAGYLFFVISLLTLAYVHSYMYTLYRELL